MTASPRTIPEIRTRLHEIAESLDHDLVTLPVAVELHALAEETKRRRPVRDAPPRARKVTPEIKRQVRDLAARYPKMPIREIGLTLGIDGGRVSEILAGKRGEPEARP